MTQCLIQMYHQYQDTTNTLLLPVYWTMLLSHNNYSEEVVWRADRVEVDETEFSVQRLTKYNGDHDWACRVDNKSNYSYFDLQTFIRGENSLS